MDYQVVVTEPARDRRILCGDYLILYRVHEAERTVEVLRFWHGARGTPRIWHGASGTPKGELLKPATAGTEEGQPTLRDVTAMVQTSLGQSVASATRFPTGLHHFVYDVITMEGTDLVVRVATSADSPLEPDWAGSSPKAFPVPGRASAPPGWST